MFKSFLKVLTPALILFSAIISYAAQPLTAKVEIPYPDSIVRGDIPVFGKAYGRDFKEFILDYGEGKDPKKWTIITKSDIAQKEYNTSVGIDMTSFGKTIEGNLGTWDTGLDEYKYGKHPVNLSGAHTLRLRVFNNKGNFVEDKVALEVGRIILNSIGGKVQSKDGVATLEVKEHSLYTSGLLASLKSLGKNPFPQENLMLIGNVYELREPGEKFTQSVILKIKYDTNADPATLRIYFYDPQKKNWQPLDTAVIKEEKTILAELMQFPDKFALYAVFSSEEEAKNMLARKQVLPPDLKGKILFQNDTFEEGLGKWHTKYPDVGAKLSLERKDDTNCLKLTNQISPSNFSSSVIIEPFNAKEHPFIKFDYKIPKDLKINFQIKTGGKWYDIVFTDDEKIYWDVNMEKIGKIENVIADDKWHTAYFNLYDMLKDKTNDFMIQEVTMADWDIAGFMKLEFGNNKKGDAFYIDNFMIAPCSSDLIINARKAFDAKDFDSAPKYAQACIELYEQLAIEQQGTLKNFPQEEEIKKYDFLNDTAAAYFVLAEILKIEKRGKEAKEKYQYIIQNFSFAQSQDPHGYFWKVAEAAKGRIFTIETGYDFGDYSSEYLTNKAWEGFDKKDYRQVEVYAQKCTHLYEEQAKSQEASLKDFAPDSFIPYYWSLNNVGTCYFILGESYLAQKRYDKAKKTYQKVINDYSHARCWDPRGWFWKVSEVTRERLKKIK